jgi:hypothetical protein
MRRDSELLVYGMCSTPVLWAWPCFDLLAHQTGILPMLSYVLQLSNAPLRLKTLV